MYVMPGVRVVARTLGVPALGAGWWRKNATWTRATRSAGLQDIAATGLQKIQHKFTARIHIPYAMLSMHIAAASRANEKAEDG